jgi:hypothetical protein
MFCCLCRRFLHDTRGHNFWQKTPNPAADFLVLSVFLAIGTREKQQRNNNSGGTEQANRCVRRRKAKFPPTKATKMAARSHPPADKTSGSCGTAALLNAFLHDNAEIKVWAVQMLKHLSKHLYP